MTPVFCCGFECGQIGSNGQHWQSGGNASISTTVVRSGSSSLRINPSGAVGLATSAILTSANIYVWRVYVRFESLPTSDSAVCYASSLSGNPGAYFKQSDNKIYAGVAGSFGSTGVSVTTNVWYRLDVMVNSSANPWLIDVLVNGNVCGQYSNAAAAANNQFINLGADTTKTFDIYYDDLVISNTSADYPIGEGYVNHFVPTADGTHNVAGANDFEIGTGGVDITNATTTVYQLVDDIPIQTGAPGTTDFINMIAPPNATDYVECIFGPPSGVLTPVTPPRAVEVIAGIAQSATGTGNMEIRMNDNGTLNAMYSATGVAGVTTIAFKRKHYATGPSGAAWHSKNDGSNGDFRDLRVRFGSPAVLDVNPDQYFTSIMIEAEFAQWPQKILNINQSAKRAAYI
jgi:hypothetical protein